MKLGIGNEFEDTVSTLLSVAPAVGTGSLETFVGACVAGFVAAAAVNCLSMDSPGLKPPL